MWKNRWNLKRILCYNTPKTQVYTQFIKMCINHHFFLKKLKWHPFVIYHQFAIYCWYAKIGVIHHIILQELYYKIQTLYYFEMINDLQKWCRILWKLLLGQFYASVVFWNTLVGNGNQHPIFWISGFVSIVGALALHLIFRIDTKVLGGEVGNMRLSSRVDVNFF